MKELNEAEVAELLSHMNKYFVEHFEGDYYGEGPALKMLMELEDFVEQLMDKK